MWGVYHQGEERAMMNSDHEFSHCDCYEAEKTGLPWCMVAEMFVVIPMLFTHSFVTSGSRFLMRSAQICLCRTFGMDRAC
jgi:hypothetical protein